jgi:orotate phosphoribosyltransferase
MSNVFELLIETGALLEGHFSLSSGRHSDRYFQCAKLLQYPQKAQEALSEVTEKILRDIKDGKLKVDIVAGPAIGGIIAAWEAARQFGLPSVFTERDDNSIMTLRRGFELPAGTNVLIVEDVVTTGKSSLECANALSKSGAIVTALACIVDRRAGKDNNIPWPMYPAIKLSAGNWDASDCELCKKGIPAVKPGSRK